MEIDLRALFWKETGLTPNTDGLCECGIFRMQDQDYIKWLESHLGKRMQDDVTEISEVQARQMAWKICDALELDKKATINVVLDVWKEFKYIK
jgi:hypothetical protein